MSKRKLSDVDQWGPSFWFTFHMSATAYPIYPTENEKRAMKEVIKTVPLLLPCISCSLNAVKFISPWIPRLDWVVENKNNLFWFWWNFHNHVNKETKKPELSFEKAKELYQFK